MNAESLHTGSAGRSGGMGGRLRLRREQLGLSLEEAASRLKLPAHVLAAIEGDDWQSLGAAVFVRGHLRAYGRLLGLEEALVEQALPYDLPPLVVSGPVVPAWRRRIWDWSRGALYALLTGFIVVPVVLFVLERAPRTPELLPLDEAEVDVAALTEPAEQRFSPAGERVGPGSEEILDPLLASLFPPRSVDRPALVAPPAPNALELRILATSWVEVRAADGSRLEFATLPAGTERRFPLGEGLTVTIGNVAGTELRIGERSLSIEPWVRANVARFRVSSQGEVEPPQDP